MNAINEVWIGNIVVGVGVLHRQHTQFWLRLVVILRFHLGKLILSGNHTINEMISGKI